MAKEKVEKEAPPVEKKAKSDGMPPAVKRDHKKDKPLKLGDLRGRNEHSGLMVGKATARVIKARAKDDKKNSDKAKGIRNNGAQLWQE